MPTDRERALVHAEELLSRLGEKPTLKIRIADAMLEFAAQECEDRARELDAADAQQSFVAGHFRRADELSATRRMEGEIMDKHPYTSTACQHAIHIECRLRCKFCSAPCMCSCHEKEPKPEAQKESNGMIIIKPSPTADTRTCDFASVTKDTLLASSHQHIADVREGLRYLESMVRKAAENHDADKITDIDGFHRDFVTGFTRTEWWDRHRKLNRHHLNNDDGVPEDVNLIDVMDFIVDCVMAGMARSGSVYPLALDATLLEEAFQNTVALMKRNVMVIQSQPPQLPESAQERGRP